MGNASSCSSFLILMVAGDLITALGGDVDGDLTCRAWGVPDGEVRVGESVGDGLSMVMD